MLGRSFDPTIGVVFTSRVRHKRLARGVFSTLVSLICGVNMVKLGDSDVCHGVGTNQCPTTTGDFLLCGGNHVGNHLRCVRNLTVQHTGRGTLFLTWASGNGW